MISRNFSPLFRIASNGIYRFLCSFRIASKIFCAHFRVISMDFCGVPKMASKIFVEF